MECGSFVQGAERKQKRGQKAPKLQNYTLTTAVGCYIMKLHTVIVCLSMAILPNMVILPQDVDAVKYEVMKI